jgi:hypothetical protein
VSRSAAASSLTDAPEIGSDMNLILGQAVMGATRVDPLAEPEFLFSAAYRREPHAGNTEPEKL